MNFLLYRYFNKAFFWGREIMISKWSFWSILCKYNYELISCVERMSGWGERGESIWKVKIKTSKCWTGFERVLRNCWVNKKRNIYILITELVWIKHKDFIICLAARWSSRWMFWCLIFVSCRLKKTEMRIFSFVKNPLVFIIGRIKFWRSIT